MLLFLTEFNPNGTNDLIICNDNFEVMKVIPECTFGYGNQDFTHSLAFDGVISDAEALQDEELQETGITGLYQVELRDIMKRICTSPVDPQGHKVLFEMHVAGLLDTERFLALTGREE